MSARLHPNESEAGLGRSGVFAGALAQEEARRRGTRLDAYSVVKTMRSQRYGVVQTLPQYQMLSVNGV